MFNNIKKKPWEWTYEIYGFAVEDNSQEEVTKSEYYQLNDKAYDYLLKKMKLGDLKKQVEKLEEELGDSNEC